jgi:hypothetical protein
MPKSSTYELSIVFNANGSKYCQKSLNFCIFYFLRKYFRFYLIETFLFAKINQLCNALFHLSVQYDTE